MRRKTGGRLFFDPDEDSSYTNARLMRYAFAAFSLAAALFAGCATARGGGERHTVRVLVLNMHAGTDASGDDNIDRVAGLVREVRADIVLLQEVDRGVKRSAGIDQPAELARRTGFHHVFGRTLDYQGGEYGIALLARWPIVSDTLVQLPVSPPQERAGGSREPRGVLHAIVDTPHGDVHVLNTHLDPSADDRWRRQEADSVIALARRAAAGGATVLIGGDFNSTPESVVQQSLRRAALRDAWTECGSGAGLTFPAAVPVKRIDYLYMLGPIGCARGTVHESQASDHRGLVVEIRFPALAPSALPRDDKAVD